MKSTLSRSSSFLPPTISTPPPLPSTERLIQPYEPHLRDLTSIFVEFRLPHLHRLKMEIHRLEKRLDQLVQTFKSEEPNSQFKALLINGLLWADPLQRQREAEVVPWQDDAEVTHCPLCYDSLKQRWLVRRHHCRLCGKVFCDKCCHWVAAEDLTFLKIPVPETAQFWLCKTCWHLSIQRKQDALKSDTEDPTWLIIFQKLKQIQQELDPQLKDFSQLVQEIQQQASSSSTAVRYRTLSSTSQASFTSMDGSSSSSPSRKAQVKRMQAERLKKELQEEFAIYDRWTLRLKAITIKLESQGVSPTELKVCRNVLQWSQQYFQANRPLLYLLTPPEEEDETRRREPEQRTNESLATPPTSEFRTVLQEQMNQVEQQVKQASRERRWEDVQLLQSNLQELKEALKSLNN